MTRIIFRFSLNIGPSRARASKGPEYGLTSITTKISPYPGKNTARRKSGNNPCCSRSPTPIRDSASASGDPPFENNPGIRSPAPPLRPETRSEFPEVFQRRLKEALQKPITIPVDDDGSIGV